MPGGSRRFSLCCQVLATTVSGCAARKIVRSDVTDLYEPFLDDNTPAMKFLPPLYVENEKPISHKDIPGPFYSSTYFTDRMIGFLEGRNKEKPFFSYLPFTAPHCA